MLKKGILITVFLFVILSGIALATEEQQSCESQSLPEGFTCIEGTKGQTIFSEEQLNSVLGEDSFEIKENEGVILLKYKVPGSRAMKDLGYLSGRVVQYKDPSVLTVSSFIASDYSKLNVSISNGFNLKPNAPNDISSIEFSSLVGNIRYTEHNYTFLCKAVSGEGRQTSSARCIMAVVIKASQDASCFSSNQRNKCFSSSLNVLNLVVAVHNSKLQNYINGEEVSEEYITPLENLENIELLNSSEMDLAGRTGSMTNAQFRGFDTLVITAVTGDSAGGSLFGKLRLDTEGQLARLEHQTLYSGRTNEQGRSLWDDSYYIITAKKASVDYTSGANIVMFANNLEEGAEGIKIKVGADNLMQLRRGALILISNSLAYEGCHSTVSPNLQVDYRPFLSSRFFRDKGCANISEGVINIKPRSYQNAVDGNTYPFTLDITLPQSSAYTDLNLKPFETYGTIPSSVTLRKSGLPNTVIFYADDINTPVDEIRNIFDLGVSFSAYVYHGTGFREGDVIVNELAYDHIWCNIQERKCWLQTQGGTATQWLGESPARTTVRCSADADCGNMGVSKCIEGHCVRASDCKQVPDVNPSTVTNRKLDILFVNDLYKSSGEQTDETSFTEYIKEQLLSSGNRVGLLTAAPFYDTNGKIASWYIQSEIMPVNPFNNGFEAAQFVNEIRKRCPQSDQIIVVSKQDFTPHTQGMKTGVIYFSVPSAQSLVYDSNKVGRVLMHEFGHGFGGLADEYTGGGTSTFIDSPNCVSDEPSARREWGTLANSALRENNGHPWTGCGGACANINGVCINYLKPSDNSLMHDADHIRRLEGAAYNSVSQKIISDLLREYS